MSLSTSAEEPKSCACSTATRLSRPLPCSVDADAERAEAVFKPHPPPLKRERVSPYGRTSTPGSPPAFRLAEGLQRLSEGRGKRALPHPPPWLGGGRRRRRFFEMREIPLMNCVIFSPKSGAKCAAECFSFLRRAVCNNNLSAPVSFLIIKIYLPPSMSTCYTAYGTITSSHLNAACTLATAHIYLPACPTYQCHLRCYTPVP